MDRGGGKGSHHSRQPVSQPSLTHTQENIILQCDHSSYKNTYFIAEISTMKLESSIRILNAQKTNLFLPKFGMHGAPVHLKSSMNASIYCGQRCHVLLFLAAKEIFVWKYCVAVAELWMTSYRLAIDFTDHKSHCGILNPFITRDASLKLI